MRMWITQLFSCGMRMWITQWFSCGMRMKITQFTGRDGGELRVGKVADCTRRIRQGDPFVGRPRSAGQYPQLFHLRRLQKQPRQSQRCRECPNDSRTVGLAECRPLFTSGHRNLPDHPARHALPFSETVDSCLGNCPVPGKKSSFFLFNFSIDITMKNHRFWTRKEKFWKNKIKYPNEWDDVEWVFGLQSAAHHVHNDSKYNVRLIVSW